MIIPGELFLKSKIKEYYQNNFVEIPDLEKREFGYGIPGKKIANRHLALRDNKDLNNFLREEVPFYVSYSVAYYKEPGAKPMQAKQYLGGDMVFEFDSDDIPTDCKKIHDTWRCEKCNESGKGFSDKCPNCNAPTKTEEWVCDHCIDATKKQTEKLYKTLINDFGIDEKEITIMYSGHKGFHIKVKSPKVYNLKQQQRLEMMNYINEDGLNFKAIGFVPDEKGSIQYVGKNYGKGQKYLDYVKKAIETYDISELTIMFGGYTGTIKKIIDNKEQALADLENGKFFKFKNDSVSLWYNFLDAIKQKQTLYIDRQTTVDVHKIVRAENTIHGGAMLISKVIPYENLKNFRPFEDAAPFKDSVLKINLKKVPKLILDGKVFGPYENEVLELPSQFALYFLAKGVVNEVII